MEGIFFKKLICAAFEKGGKAILSLNKLAMHMKDVWKTNLGNCRLVKELF